ncbi:MAG: hypothetical protein ACW99G_11380 [Candidatus Thorarchaeota archaeon]|jgi:hypothetical protein
MNDSAREMLIEILLTIGIVLFFLSPLILIIILSVHDAHEKCNIFAELNPDFDIMYVKRHGCMVKYNGMFVSVDDVVNVLTRR